MKKEMTNGSPKQIKWANDIRDSILNGLYAMKEAGFNLDYTIERLENANNAKWWIERKVGFGFSDILPEIEFNKHIFNGILKDEPGKGNIKGFYYHESKNEYAVIVGYENNLTDESLVKLPGITALREKVKEVK